MAVNPTQSSYIPNGSSSVIHEQLLHQEYLHMKAMAGETRERAGIPPPPPPPPVPQFPIWLRNSSSASIKADHELQKQLLLQEFQRQQVQLLEMQKRQLQTYLESHQQVVYAKELELKQIQLANDKLEKLRHKSKKDESANASKEVKDRLKAILLNKKQRQAAQLNSQRFSSLDSGYEGHQMNVGLNQSPVSSASLLSLGEYDIRRTSSEPNLKVPSALRHRIFSKQSPLTRGRKGRSPLQDPSSVGEGSQDSPINSSGHGTLSAQSSLEDSCPSPRSAAAAPLRPPLRRQAETINGGSGFGGSLGSSGELHASLPDIALFPGPLVHAGPLLAPWGVVPYPVLQRTHSLPIPVVPVPIGAKQYQQQHALGMSPLLRLRDSLPLHLHHRNLHEDHTIQEENNSAMDDVKRSRTLSEPPTRFSVLTSPRDGVRSAETKKAHAQTGVAYDEQMLLHECTCRSVEHLETPARLRHIWMRLTQSGLLDRCEIVPGRRASRSELQLAHSSRLAAVMTGKAGENVSLAVSPLPCGGVGVDADTVWDPERTPIAARVAAGCVLELVNRVATGHLRNGFAIIRPPGHHAEPDQPMGFCFVNSVAVAAKYLRERMRLERVLVVDWDVHHCNGTQMITYDDPGILLISLHRYDDGGFFPGTGSPHECGHDAACGFNVNVAFSGGLEPPMGDAEYLAAFRAIVLPIAREFGPEMVLVSCGFAAARGHPPQLGGYTISPAMFGWMTEQLLQLAEGHVVLALEGGFVLDAVSECTEHCLRALLPAENERAPTPKSKFSLPESAVGQPPNAHAVESLQKVAAIQARFWPSVARHVGLIHLPHKEACERDEQLKAGLNSRFALLSVQRASD